MFHDQSGFPIRYGWYLHHELSEKRIWSPFRDERLLDPPFLKNKNRIVIRGHSQFIFKVENVNVGRG
jgi:hypothetical protein